MPDPNSKRLLAIINPIAGRGDTGKLRVRLEELARRAEVEIEIRLTESAGHATKLAAQAASTGFDAVIGCGGNQASLGAGVELHDALSEPHGTKVPFQVDGDFSGYLPISGKVIANGLTLLQR